MALTVAVFGATGMVGQAALLECLDDLDVARVVTVGRSPVPQRSSKLVQITQSDITDLAPHRAVLADVDGCLFCLGVSSAGIDPDRYRAITYDLTVAIGRQLAEFRPNMVFLYVSGAGTDTSEQGRVRWARVKGATENALFDMPLDAYGLRPGLIRARRGVRSRTRLYAALYLVIGGLGSLLRRVAPNAVIDSDELGRAMLRIVKERPDQRIFSAADLIALVRGTAPKAER